MFILTFTFCIVVAAVNANALVQGEDVPIQISDMTVDESGRVQIQVPSTSDYYYVLYRRDDQQEETEWPVAMILGEDGTTILTEPLGVHGPLELYRVTQHRRDHPADTDGDGIDDVEELLNPIRLSPLNPAQEVILYNGAVSIPDQTTFQELSYQGLEVYIDEQLKDLEFVKFWILEDQTDHPQVYFMNTNTHRIHGSFLQGVGISLPGIWPMHGEIVYHPYVMSANGEPGLYRLEFQPGDAHPFAAVQMAYELLAANMPVLRNNFAYCPMFTSALARYQQEKHLYDASRVSILLQEDIYANSTYLPMNMTEGYGLLRLMDLDERPTARDIVLYRALPNEMPRVGGIITSVPQNPLSHVNLRAIQDSVPNAYIKGAMDNEMITSLIGTYVYLKVGADGYEIREAALANVEAHYAGLRPTEPQIPIRDLSVTQITPLDAIDFRQSSSFGVKTANLATLRRLEFPEGTVPNGFGIPFYFYDEFMKYNGFYEQALALFNSPQFQQDFDEQEEMLSDFRKTIRSASMPNWMWNALTELQGSFPSGLSLRCRSSTNNEDLPGFSGAGLYTSKTQHPDEGHISKSIKQVYASLWNFRAVDERQFYRIDHLMTAMGVLVHPNFSDEIANGVGVTKDPFYHTTRNYYLNTQVGEDLVTNPEAFSIPEEILMPSWGLNYYTILRRSNQVADNNQVLSLEHINELREYMGQIHSTFSDLYNTRVDDDFAMEIEFKITADDKLVIKQARPWIN